MGMCGMMKILSESEYKELQENPMDVEDILFPDSSDDPFSGQFDLDKCWHELHFLLTGSIAPDGTILGDAVLGGEELGPDLGYGRARLVSPDRAKFLFQALGDLDFDGLCQKLDKSSPGIDAVYAGEGLRGDLRYLERPFRILVDAYRTAASRESAILCYLT